MGGLFGGAKIFKPTPPKVVRAPMKEQDTRFMLARQEKRRKQEDFGRQATQMASNTKTGGGSA